MKRRTFFRKALGGLAGLVAVPALLSPGGRAGIHSPNPLTPTRPRVSGEQRRQRREPETYWTGDSIRTKFPEAGNFKIVYGRHPECRPLCPYLFKGQPCGYSGSAACCDKTHAHCEELGNLHRFGGYRKAVEVEIKNIDMASDALFALSDETKKTTITLDELNRVTRELREEIAEACRQDLIRAAVERHEKVGWVL